MIFEDIDFRAIQCICEVKRKQVATSDVGEHTARAERVLDHISEVRSDTWIFT